MANSKLCLYSGNTTKKGSSIKLVIRKNNDRKLISLGLYANLDQWDDELQRYIVGKGKHLHPDRYKNNEYLNRKEIEANDILEDFEKQKINWTLNQFESVFLNKTRQGFVAQFINKIVADLRATGHIGNATCYERVLHMLCLFDIRFDKRIFSELDVKYINAFDVWLQTPRSTEYQGDRLVERKGCSGNTRKYYHKALRAIINKAIQIGEASNNTYPYGKGKFEVSKLEETTAKRYLINDHIELIKNKEIENTTIEIIRRLFLFSYYCHGISYVDMAQLSKENIFQLEDGEYIIYKRQKIKNQKGVKPLSIKITPEIKDLLNWFAENTLILSDYITPCITRDYEGEQIGRAHV